MNDYHAIAEKVEALGGDTYSEWARSIENLHSLLINEVMGALDAIERDPNISAEQSRDISDFAFNQRSYR